MPVIEEKKDDLSVCVIGAGFSGLCGAIRLIRDLDCQNFEIFEMNENVGGTWFSNRYLGCACDIPIHGYCLSFEKRADWRAQYASHEEIYHYLQDVASKYGLYSKTHFNHTVKRLEWNNATKQWTLTIQNNRNGETFIKSYDIVISATGSIRIPKIPEQFEKFHGPILHTAKWDASVDLINKRVAVVGTGASGIQVVPQASKVARSLVVFQRKPSWILPKYDFEFGVIIRFLFKHVPFLMVLYQMVLFFLFETVYFAMRKNSLVHRIVTGICNWHRIRQIGHSRTDLLEKLTPTYELGCQRTAFANDYYPVFTKPTTKLVTSKVASVSGNTIVTEEGTQFDVDVLILATGFRITDYFSPMEIVDRNGESLLKIWKKDAPSLFMGMSSHNLPNLFILYGPNTSTGHNSVVKTVEMQMDWVVNCLIEKRKRKAKVVAVKSSTVDNYMNELQDQLKGMVWDNSGQFGTISDNSGQFGTMGSCSSWYTDDQGRNVSIFPWTLTSFWRRVRAFDYNQLEFE